MAGQVAFPYFQTSTASAVRAKRLHALAPRMAPSALRVPHPIHAQFPLVFVTNHPQVFVHEGARQALERRLEQGFQGPVALHINDNVRSIITVRRRAGQLRARVHHMFLDAPHQVQEALVRYLVAGTETTPEARAASALINRYIADNHHRIRASRPPLHPLKTEGKVHDLLSLFRRVNERYFSGTHDALVTWGRVGRAPRQASAESRRSRRSIKLGSYSAVERLIRLHPILDRPWVPRYFVEYILYHEMLHHVIPAGRVCGRAVLHPPEFRQREREFHVYERSIQWEREHIGRLLRA
jgi:hypothetical protein